MTGALPPQAEPPQAEPPQAEPPRAEPPRSRRADAQRNYARLLVVAKEAFGEHGADAPLDDIAKRAGVGAGTLYRHFPTREALMAAVYRDDVAELSAQAYDLLERMSPEEALAEWMRMQIAYIIRKRGLGTALVTLLGKDSELFAWCRDALRGAGAALLQAAQRAGAVRTDVDAADLLRLGHSIAVATEHSPQDAERLLTVVLDGLRAQP
jgi:AcrR family transcriptional regulator